MLCAGVVHGDLSDFNVLMGVDGPVLIDFPQSVDPAHNQNARKLLLRDVDNLHRFLERSSPVLVRRAYAMEMWSLYEANRLEPDSELRGDYRAPEGKANTKEVLALIDDARFEEQARRHARGEEAPANAGAAPKPLREVVDFTKQARPKPKNGKRVGAGRRTRPARPRGGATEKPAASKAAATNGSAAPKKRRSRRRRKSSGEAGGDLLTKASQSDAAVTKTTLTPNETSSSKRRRGRRSQARSKPEENGVGARSGAKRPAKPAASTRGGSEPGSSDRPARRRRRRPRPERSRETT
jgi:RIO kinase 1